MVGAGCGVEGKTTVNRLQNSPQATNLYMLNQVY